MRKMIFRITALLMAGMLMLTACRAPIEEDTGSLVLYFTDEDKTSLFTASENNSALRPWRNVETYIDSILERLAHPEEYEKKIGADQTLCTVIPEGLIQSIDVTTIYSEGFDSQGNPQIDRIAKIHLSQGYYDLKVNEWIVFRTGLSQTLFSTEQVSELQFLAPQKGGEAEIDRALRQDKMMINTYNEEFYNDEVRVILYFLNEDETMLVPEERVLTLGFAQPLSEAIVEALIEGPKAEGHAPSIPDGTQINKILLEDGVCYIDLSSEFQLNHEGGELMEKLTIYSIVNSLQSVNGLVYVQFLIDGERVPTYKNYVSLDHFLIPDDSFYQGQ